MRSISMVSNNRNTTHRKSYSAPFKFAIPLMTLRLTTFTIGKWDPYESTYCTPIQPAQSIRLVSNTFLSGLVQFSGLGHSRGSSVNFCGWTKAIPSFWPKLKYDQRHPQLLLIWIYQLLKEHVLRWFSLFFAEYGLWTKVPGQQTKMLHIQATVPLGGSWQE